MIPPIHEHEATYPKMRDLIAERVRQITEWDRPAEVYMVLGSPEEPQLAYLTSSTTDMEAVFDKIGSLDPPPEVIGLFAIDEGWMHLSFEEASQFEGHPLQVLASMIDTNGLDIPEDRKEAIYYHFARNFSPAEIKESIGKDAVHEHRLAYFFFRDGGNGLLMHNRHEGDLLRYNDHSVETFKEMGGKYGRLQRAMGRAIGVEFPEMEEGGDLAQRF